MISLFDKRNQEFPLFRHFIDAGSDVTIARDGRFRTASLYYLLSDAGVPNYWEPENIQFSDGFAEAVHSVLEPYPHESALDRIFHHQEQIRKTALQLRRQAEKDRIDAELSIVPTAPTGFEEWVRNVLMRDQQFVFYYYDSRGDHRGACSVCGKEGVFPTARRGAKGVCPACGKEITFLPQRGSADQRKKRQAALIQRVGEVLIVRVFSVACVQSRTDEPFRRQRFSFHEWYRRLYFLPEANYKSYEFGNFKQTEEWRWCAVTPNDRYMPIDLGVYPEGITEALQGTPWQYSRLEVLATGIQGASLELFSFLHSYPRNPAMEYVIRAGLYEYVRDVLWGGWCHESDLRLLRELTKAEIDTLRAVNGTSRHAEMLLAARKNGVRLTAEELREVVEVTRGDTRVTRILQQTTVSELSDYLRRSLLRKDMLLSSWYNLYYDYFQASEELRTFFHRPLILFPKNLRDAHDRTTAAKRELDEVLRQKKLDQWSAMLRRLKPELEQQYSFEADGLRVVVPGSREELKKEGEAMKNCIVTYLEMIAKKESVVLFLRKKENPEKPFADLEIRDGQIRQCRRSCNQDATEELRPFLDKFAAEKRLRVSV